MEAPPVCLVHPLQHFVPAFARRLVGVLLGGKKETGNKIKHFRHKVTA